MAPVDGIVKPKVGYTELLQQPEDGRRYDHSEGVTGGADGRFAH